MTNRRIHPGSLSSRIASIAVLASLVPACGNKTLIDDKGGPRISAAAPVMGTADTFAVLAATTVTNLGPTVITGNLGLSPGTSITGFPPGSVVNGTIHAADAVALQAQNDTTTAYDALAAQPCTVSYDVPTDLGGMTLAPGVYCFASSAALTGTVTLDAGGDAAAVFVFKTVSTLITASGSSVLLINGADPCNVFWKVGSSATLGTGTTFVGSILALTSIGLDTGASLSGRALARTGAVTLDSNVVGIDSCAELPASPTPPVLAKAFSPATIEVSGISTLTITLSNADTNAAVLIAPLTDALPSGTSIAGAATTDCGGTVTTGVSSVTLTGGSIAAGGYCTIVVDVTSCDEGSYVNVLAAGALFTSNGANALPAEATLTVVAGTPAP